MNKFLFLFLTCLIQNDAIIECSNHGKYNDGLCYCYPGYTGMDCEYSPGFGTLLLLIFVLLGLGAGMGFYLFLMDGYIEEIDKHNEKNIILDENLEFN